MAENSFKNILSKHFNNYLNEWTIETQNQMVKNIEDGKDFKGKPFKALKKSTKDERARKGYGRAKPILIRTGGLKDSIRVVADQINKSIRISSTLPYADDLNDGNHSGWWGKHAINADMPPRKFLEQPISLKSGSTKEQSILNKYIQLINEELMSEMDTRLEKAGFTGLKK